MLRDSLVTNITNKDGILHKKRPLLGGLFIHLIVVYGPYVPNDVRLKSSRGSISSPEVGITHPEEGALNLKTRLNK
jgi:hypothetical protein